MSKAIIVPGVTDLNKGDQALVWESVRLVEELNYFDDISILDNGDTDEEKAALCNQSKKKGFTFIDNILKHPRRGKHNKLEHSKDGIITTLRLIFFSIIDFISLSFLLFICNKQGLVKLFFNIQVVDTVKAFRESEVIFVKGGGFIHSYGEISAPYLIWFFLFYIKLGKKLNNQVIVLPNSFGPFIGPTVKKQVKRVFNEVDLILARENVSAKALGTLLEKDIIVLPDLGFYVPLVNSNDPLVNELFNEKGIYHSEKLVGITVRPWRFPQSKNSAESYRKYTGAVAIFSDNLTELGYTVVFCNQSIGPSAHEDDRLAIADVIRLKKREYVWINEDLTCEQLKLIYSKFDFLIGTRFHSVIFSLTSGVPSIAIGYGGNKAEGIMGEFQLDGYSIPIDKVDEKILISKFSNLVDHQDEIKKTLKNSVLTFGLKRKLLLNTIYNTITKK
jgi:colanic acid/amylovoran biosynthesis protein